MTAFELKGMSTEDKRKLYYNTIRIDSVPINSEKDSINTVIERYANTEMPLDDMSELKKELSEIIA